MDVVKTNIEKIGGVVDVHSRRGNGTTFRIKIPLTLAIIPALIVTSGGDRYAVPQISLLELVRLKGTQARDRIEIIQGAPVYRLRGNLLPLVYLNRELEIQSAARAADDQRRDGQHRGAAGRQPPLRAGRRPGQRHRGDRGQAARPAPEGHHRVRGRDHHGRRARGADPRHPGHRAAGERDVAGARSRGGPPRSSPRTTRLRSARRCCCS